MAGCTVIFHSRENHHRFQYRKRCQSCDKNSTIFLTRLYPNYCMQLHPKCVQISVIWACTHNRIACMQAFIYAYFISCSPLKCHCQSKEFYFHFLCISKSQNLKKKKVAYGPNIGHHDVESSCRSGRIPCASSPNIHFCFKHIGWERQPVI